MPKKAYKGLQEYARKNYVKNIKTMIYYKSNVGDKNGIIKGSR